MVKNSPFLNSPKYGIKWPISGLTVASSLGHSCTKRSQSDHLTSSFSKFFETIYGTLVNNHSTRWIRTFHEGFIFGFRMKIEIDCFHGFQWDCHLHPPFIAHAELPHLKKLATYLFLSPCNRLSIRNQPKSPIFESFWKTSIIFEQLRLIETK